MWLQRVTKVVALEVFFKLYGDALETDWDRYSNLFLEQKFEQNRRNSRQEWIQDLQRDQSMEEILGCSRLDMKETTNRIKNQQ